MINGFRLSLKVILGKGTNRFCLFRGEVDKYSWVDLVVHLDFRSSIASYLWAQIENLKDVQARSYAIGTRTKMPLERLAWIRGIQLATIPIMPAIMHTCSIWCVIIEKRMPVAEESEYIKGIEAVFHYQSLPQKTHTMKAK
jgi:dTDP-4-amino-4,6-dideoxygalactose transaminase